MTIFNSTPQSIVLWYSKFFFLSTIRMRLVTAVVCAAFPLALGYKTISGHTKGPRAYIYIMRNLPVAPHCRSTPSYIFHRSCIALYATCRCGALVIWNILFINIQNEFTCFLINVSSRTLTFVLWKCKLLWKSMFKGIYVFHSWQYLELVCKNIIQYLLLNFATKCD